MGRSHKHSWAGYVAIVAAGLLAVTLVSLPFRVEAYDAPPGRGSISTPQKPGIKARVKTTGYCECQKCCSWRRSWFGFGPPVVASGPNRGDPKTVGMTASGSWVRPGVIAADPEVFPMGTIFRIPGYGWGRVEDTGGAIKGYHIDLYFDGHRTAQEWGVRIKEVQFWRPAGSAPVKRKILEARVQAD